MIVVRPDNAAGRVLALLVQEPGELTAEAIAARLHPEPVHRGPFTPATYRAHLQALREHRAEDRAAERVRKVAGLLHRLQQQGLVERLKPVHVAAAFERTAARRGDAEALHLSQPDDDGEARARDLGAHQAVVALVRSAPTSARLRATLAEGGGWRWRVYGELAEWGVLITPARRWPSEKGVALVASWKTSAAQGQGNGH